tara:strand:- start:736 stop:996 length:261 start_codon:yes stop_codon:yes gene_type:complete
MMNKEETEKAMDKIMLTKDLKTQSDEIIRLNIELKRVTKKASVMEGDNFRLIEAYDLLNKNYGKMVDEIEEQRIEINALRKQYRRL